MRTKKSVQLVSQQIRHDRILEGLEVVDSELRFYVAKFRVKSYMAPQDIEDMRSDAIVSMITAVDRYDPSKKTALKTYLSHRMKGFFKDYFRKESKYTEIRLEEKSDDLSTSIHNVMDMDVSKATIVLEQLNINNETCLDICLDIDNTDPEFSRILYDVLVELPDVRVYVILSYYILNREVKEIAKELGMSTTSGWIYRIKRQSVDYIKNQILIKLDERG